MKEIFTSEFSLRETTKKEKDLLDEVSFLWRYFTLDLA